MLLRQHPKVPKRDVLLFGFTEFSIKQLVASGKDISRADSKKEVFNEMIPLKGTNRRDTVLLILFLLPYVAQPVCNRIAFLFTKSIH